MKLFVVVSMNGMGGSDAVAAFSKQDDAVRLMDDASWIDKRDLQCSTAPDELLVAYSYEPGEDVFNYAGVFVTMEEAELAHGHRGHVRSLRIDDSLSPRETHSA